MINDYPAAVNPGELVSPSLSFLRRKVIEESLWL